MPASFVSEPLLPLGGSFDTALMAQGEPGLPQWFRWRGQEWRVAAILEKWKEHGDCRHGSGERWRLSEKWAGVTPKGFLPWDEESSEEHSQRAT